MNKTAIKNYAVWARNALIKQVTQKAYEYEVTKDSVPSLNTVSVNGRLLSNDEKNQLNDLIVQVNKYGFIHVVEEIAYTWFNRFIALRYMEVNNYLPQKVRIFTNENNEFKPEILTEAIHLDLDNLDKQKVFGYIQNNNQEDLYKYLLLTICNDMNKYLPDMFTSIKDYKALLLPDNLLKEDSVLDKLIKDIDEDSFKDQVQIIGWMYQYYISERHDEVINILKGTVKKEDIPAATQLFTTDWVVRYMVDNSLGRYWIERNPNSELKKKLEFLATSKDGTIPFVDDPKKPEEITFIDPCMGSGHILVYAFDVLMEIYRECGYSDRDAAHSIIENNLYGLDIDERAYQLSYFSVMMKGRSYSRRILTSNVKNNISNIIETNDIKSLAYYGMNETDEMKEMSDYLLHAFKDALELGSLCIVENKDYDSYLNKIQQIHDTSEYTLDSMEWMDKTYYIINKLVKQAIILSKKYSVTTTNPPYLSKMEGALKKYVTVKYKDYSSDLFAVFIRRNFDLTEENGYLGFMTPFVWMFIKSYEKLRYYILSNKSISTLVQMEYSAYEEATVPICSFVLSNNKSKSIGYYFRLSDFKGGMEVQKQKVLEAIKNKDCGYFYEADSNNFSKIPGDPFAYWISDKFVSTFENDLVGDIVQSKAGVVTGNDPYFVRCWYEINLKDIGFSKNEIDEYPKYAIMQKGGPFRRYYGNNWYVIKLNDLYDGKKTNVSVRRGDADYYFKKGIGWSQIGSNQGKSFRIIEKSICGTATPTIYVDDDEKYYYLLGLLNSPITEVVVNLSNPTINLLTSDICKIPFVFSKEDKEVIHRINEKVKCNINMCKNDWDSFETSLDFTKHPLVPSHRDLLEQQESQFHDVRMDKFGLVSWHYDKWENECEHRFNTLKSNEEEINKIFMDIYGLQDELDPYVEEKNVTIRKADLTRDIKSLISYAVGCMFGRYSLDIQGLAYTGGEFDNSKYKTYFPDRDNIIPICDEEYFEDDIVSRFVEFIKDVYGEDTLEENLQFIANALGGSGNSREVLRNYFLNDFFKDHCNTYQVTGSGKRPIYWQFDSGKNNGFKALIYMHRYTPDLIARLRTTYIHPLQSRLRTQIDLLNNQIDGTSITSEKVKLSKQLKKLNNQLLELNKYEEKVHHFADMMIDIDLDDGVKVNYAKFQELLAKIK